VANIQLSDALYTVEFGIKLDFQAGQTRANSHSECT